MPTHNFIFGLLAALIALVIWRTFAKWNADEVAFYIRDLFMENGKASRQAVILLCTFAATTWFFLFYALTGRMTEGYFGLYIGAWITPTVARMITNAPASAPAAVTTTETAVSK